MCSARETKMAGCSSLPKVALSYKWVIRDAEVFLSNSRQVRSPAFLTPLHSSTIEKASWELSISTTLISGFPDVFVSR